MYYAITIKDGIITGVHESEQPITDKTFANNPKLAGQEVIPLKDTAGYQSGRRLTEYNDGILRPLLDRIAEGLAEIPDGFELIDGELVKRDVPVVDAPPKLIDMLTAANAEIAALKSKLTALEPTITTLAKDTEALKLRLPIVKESIVKEIMP